MVTDIKASPIVKTVGGKSKLIPDLVARMPAKYGMYFEPFFGGGALFFHLAPESAVIGDSNSDLMGVYTALAHEPAHVISLLEEHARRHSADHYNDVKDAWNSSKLMAQPDFVRAAQFIYLNKTCFNGLWRVNQAGAFNVPMGKYKNPPICCPDELRAVAAALSDERRMVARRTGDYRDAVSQAAEGDFVYLDSPYDGTYAGYTPDGFGDVAQAELAFTTRKLVERGVQVMVSNSDTPRIRALYAGFAIDRVSRPGTVNSDPTKRGKVGEVIITAGYRRGRAK